MQVFLETERLVLRQFTLDDVDNLVELDSDPGVMHFITGGRATPRDEIENDILPWFLHYYEPEDRYGFWVAIEKSTGKFLGWFHFRPADGRPSDEPELGYRLCRSAWGRGYATEGSRADPEGVHRVRRGTGGGECDGGSHGVPPRHGKVGPDPGADVPPGVARPHPRG